MHSKVAFPLPYRRRRQLRSYILFPCVNRIVEGFASNRGGNTPTTPVDIRHEQIVLSASGTFRHDAEVTNQLTSTLSSDRPAWLLNVFVVQRVRFGHNVEKASFGFGVTQSLQGFGV